MYPELAIQNLVIHQNFQTHFKIKRKLWTKRNFTPRPTKSTQTKGKTTGQQKLKRKLKEQSST
jgi:hypothetical protein